MGVVKINNAPFFCRHRSGFSRSLSGAPSVLYSSTIISALMPGNPQRARQIHLNSSFFFLSQFSGRSGGNKGVCVRDLTRCAYMCVSAAVTFPTVCIGGV